MAKCDICGKGVVFGIKVSIPIGAPIAPGSPTSSGQGFGQRSPLPHSRLTRCLRSGKVTRAV